MSSKKTEKSGHSSFNLLARRPINIITDRSYGDNFRGAHTSHRLSPQSHLRHHHGVPLFSDTRRRSCGNVGNLTRCNSSDTRRLSLSRDAQQPSSGSLLNLRCQSLPPESEESDVLASLLKTQLSLHSFSTALSNNRPRSFTCSDLESKKTKTKGQNRPPTPPPSATLPPENPPHFSKSSFLGTSHHSRSFDSASPILGFPSFSQHSYQHHPSYLPTPQMFNLTRRSRHSSREKIEENPLEDTLPVINEG